MKNKIDQDGAFLIYKEKGVTSFDVIRKLKSVFNFKKIGHGGTLDPFAEGVLIILINRATRFSQFLLGSEKVYEAKLYLGFSTDTFDSEGKISSFSLKNSISEREIGNILKKFIGKITQVVPNFSAAKYKGKPLYFYSRKKINVPEKIKKVEIFSLKMKGYSPPFLDFVVECSGGTYIRTLGYDMAKELCGAGHLVYLKRKSIKNFSEERAFYINDVLKLGKEEFEENMIPPQDILYWLDSVYILEEGEKSFLNGQNVALENSTKSDYVKVFCKKKFLGIGRVKGNSIYPFIVFR